MTLPIPAFIVDDLPVCGGHVLSIESMPAYAFDSRGQVWAVGSHGGRLYKTQTRQLVHA